MRGSLGALVDRLSSAAREAGVAIQLGATVNSVVQTDVEGTGVRVVVTSSNTDGVTETTTARAVVLAAPPRVLLQHVTFDPALPRKCLAIDNDHFVAASVAVCESWLGVAMLHLYTGGFVKA